MEEVREIVGEIEISHWSCNGNIPCIPNRNLEMYCLQDIQEAQKKPADLKRRMQEFTKLNQLENTRNRIKGWVSRENEYWALVTKLRWSTSRRPQRLWCG